MQKFKVQKLTLRNLLLIGEQGSAKTTLINSFFKKYKSDEHVIMNSNFSSTTTPQLFQKSVESSVDKRMGNVYGPPAGGHACIQSHHFQAIDIYNLFSLPSPCFKGST